VNARRTSAATGDEHPGRPRGVAKFTASVAETVDLLSVLNTGRLPMHEGD
jgi:hypothetical protein